MDASMLEAQATSDPLERALALTRKMLLKAQEGAWQELVALQTERDKLLQPGLLQGQARFSLSFTRSRLEQLLALNEQITALCQQERDRFGEGMRKLRQGFQACNTYRGYRV